MMTLIEAPLNQNLTIVDVNTSIAARLAAMGVVIGVELKIHQRKPAVIIEYEETLLAFDFEVAAQVQVQLCT